jgi:hypothetical protein
MVAKKASQTSPGPGGGGGKFGHGGLADPARNLVEAFDDVPGAPARQEVDGLGQQRRQQQERGAGAEAAQQEHRTPAEACLQGHRGCAAQRRPDPVAGGVEADCQAPPALGRVLTHDHVGAGEDSADADTRHHPPDTQFHGRMRQGGQQHSRGREAYGDEDHGPAPDHVGEGGQSQRAGRHADQPGAEQDAELAAAEAEIAGDAVRGERHGQDVEAIQGVEDDAQANDEPLVPGHA